VWTGPRDPFPSVSLVFPPPPNRPMTFLPQGGPFFAFPPVEFSVQPWRELRNQRILILVRRILLFSRFGSISCHYPRAACCRRDAVGGFRYFAGLMWCFPLPRLFQLGLFMRFGVRQSFLDILFLFANGTLVGPFIGFFQRIVKTGFDWRFLSAHPLGACCFFFDICLSCFFILFTPGMPLFGGSNFSIILFPCQSLPLHCREADESPHFILHGCSLPPPALCTL